MNSSLNHLLADADLGRITGMGNFAPGEVVGGTGTALGKVEQIMTVLIGFFTIVGGLTFLIYFIIGGLNWVSAGGDSKKVDTAKSYMTNGAIGMITIVAAYAIIWIVGQVLGVDILNPERTFTNLGIGGGTGNTGLPPGVPGP